MHVMHAVMYVCLFSDGENINYQMTTASHRRESYCTEFARFVSLAVFLLLSPSLELIPN